MDSWGKCVRASIRLLINLSEGLMDSCRDERLAGIWKKKGGVREREIADEISQRKIGYARQGFPTRGFTSLVSRKDLDKKKFRSTTNDWAQENNLLLFHSSDDLMAFSDILHEVSASVNWPQKEKIRHKISHKEEIFLSFFYTSADQIDMLTKLGSK